MPLAYALDYMDIVIIEKNDKSQWIYALDDFKVKGYYSRFYFHVLDYCR